MRIWVLNHNLHEEGTWHRAWNFAVQLRKDGHDVRFFTLNHRRGLVGCHQRIEGVDVWLTPYLVSKRLGAAGLDAWDILWRTAKVLAGKWDVLYSFSSMPSVSVPLLIARQVYPRRCFMNDWDDLLCDGGGYEYLNGGWRKPIYCFERFLERATKRVTNGVTTTSVYLKDRTSELRHDGCVTYIPTGANVARIPLMDKAEARQRLGIPSDRVVCTYLVGGYGLDGMRLLDAFAKAHAEHPSLYLVFISGTEPRYQQGIRANGISDAVWALGRVPFQQVPIYLAAADFLLMPMQDTPFNQSRGPIKLRDYLCAGRPIVGQAVGEVTAVLRKFEVGILADTNVESFTDAILTMARSPHHWTRLGTESRRVAEQELSWDILGKEIRSCVRQWCGGRGVSGEECIQ